MIIKEKKDRSVPYFSFFFFFYFILLLIFEFHILDLTRTIDLVQFLKR